jgi:5'-deoxynucleotidase YfbR-like HD superfamily hydrolase
MISPFKAVIGDAYRDTERLILDAVMRRFDLPAPMTKIAHDLAKRADRAAAYHEATQLAGFDPREAEVFFGAPVALDAGMRALLAPWPIGRAQAAFLERFRMLDAGPSATPTEEPA